MTKETNFGISVAGVATTWQPSLDGTLIRLRPLTEEDFDALYLAASDPSIWEQHPEPDRYTREKFIRYFQLGIESKGALAIIDQKTGQIIGSSRFTKYDPDQSSIEVGYTFLSKPYWGKGHNRELKRLMLDYAFQFVETVLFVIGEMNFRSQKAIVGIGATELQRIPGKAGSYAAIVYQMKKSDWQFKEKNQERIFRLIRSNPFATIVSVKDGNPMIGHLPVIFRQKSKPILVGHMSCRNPQSQLLTENGAVTAIFHGPHTYITPTWYAKNDVPTWNYAIVHAIGRIRWIRDFDPLVTLLQEMTDFFEHGETDGGTQWKFNLPDDLKNEADLVHAIVGFEIEVESFQAKFKFGQNRSLEDQAGIIRGLENRFDDMSKRVLQAMKEK